MRHRLYPDFRWKFPTGSPLPSMGCSCEHPGMGAGILTQFGDISGLGWIPLHLSQGCPCPALPWLSGTHLADAAWQAWG